MCVSGGGGVLVVLGSRKDYQGGVSSRCGSFCRNFLQGGVLHL